VTHASTIYGALRESKQKVTSIEHFLLMITTLTLILELPFVVIKRQNIARVRKLQNQSQMDLLSNVPPLLKPCQSFMRLAADHDKIDPVISYWCRLYALQLGLKIDSKDKDNRTFLFNVMAWLEEVNTHNSDHI
jgi:hypothetical protein